MEESGATIGLEIKYIYKCRESSNGCFWLCSLLFAFFVHFNLLHENTLKKHSAFLLLDPVMSRNSNVSGGFFFFEVGRFGVRGRCDKILIVSYSVKMF